MFLSLGAFPNSFNTSDLKKVCANSVNPDEMAHIAISSGSALFASNFAFIYNLKVCSFFSRFDLRNDFLFHLKKKKRNQGSEKACDVFHEVFYHDFLCVPNI